jgi:hypothetical protein
MGDYDQVWPGMRVDSGGTSMDSGVRQPTVAWQSCRALAFHLFTLQPATSLVLFSIFGLFVRLAELNPFLRAAVTPSPFQESAPIIGPSPAFPGPANQLAVV